MFVSEEDMQLLLQTVRGLVSSKIEPESKAIDESSNIPSASYRQLVDAGLNASNVPEAYGGGGASLVEAAAVIEEVARGSGALASLLAMNTAGVAAVAASSNEKLKNELFPSVSRGESIVVWPAGSFRERRGLIASSSSKGVVLNGRLSWVPCFDVSAKLLLLAEVVTESVPYLVVIDIASPQGGQIDIGPVESDLGLRGISLRSLSLQNVVVSPDMVLSRGPGESRLIEVLHSVANVSLAAQANGIALAALRHAKEYILERQQFGKLVSEFESTRAIFGEMALKLEAARRLTFSAASQRDGDRPGWQGQEGVSVEASAKWLACKTAVEVAIDSIQLFGGYGFVKDYPVERLMRDAKMTQLMGGTDQLLEIAEEKISVPR